MSRGSVKASDFTLYPFGWRELPNLRRDLRSYLRKVDRLVAITVTRHPVTGVFMARFPEPHADVVFLNGEYMSSADTARLLDAIASLFNATTERAKTMARLSGSR